jgi:hypothetical protein
MALMISRANGHCSMRHLRDQIDSIGLFNLRFTWATVGGVSVAWTHRS